MGVGRPVGGITSPVKMVANIFVSFIGAGMLGLPFAYKEVRKEGFEVAIVSAGDSDVFNYIVNN